VTYIKLFDRQNEDPSTTPHGRTTMTTAGADSFSEMIERFRADSTSWLSLSESRYGHDGTSPPLAMARRWAALSAEPVDWDALLAISRDAQRMGTQIADVAFHAWCNDVLCMREGLWKAWLARDTE